MKASVKIMLSYDYSHFEVALSSDQEMTAKDVNALRITAQRLADEAVRQYKKAKAAADDAAQRRMISEQELAYIERVTVSERTPEQVAKLKARDDEEWSSQFDNDYDYDEDEDAPDFYEDPAV
jgi:hypothetical protein